MLALSEAWSCTRAFVDPEPELDTRTMSVDVVAQPITFHRSGRTAPNRTLKSAMTERLCTWDDAQPDECGKPTPQYLRLYEEWGRGRIGVLVLGNMAVDRRYPEAKRNAVLDPQSPWEPISAFRPVIAAAQRDGALVVGQLTHGGRQTSDTVTPTPVSSSDVQAPPTGGMSFGKPRALTVPEIHDIVNRYAHAAHVLYEAGADGVQLHAAHGYLLSQFLSPHVNRRTDEYGGDSLDNRSRIVFEIFDAIKAAVPDERFLLSIKINSADFTEGGFDEDDSREMAIRLEAAGVDLIELSGGTYEHLTFLAGDVPKKESTKRREAFFIEFADRIRPHLNTAKLCVTGGFRSIDGMADAITTNATDLVGIARPLCAEPQLVRSLLAGKQAAAKPALVDPVLQVPACYLQLGQIGDGQPPADLSDPETARAVVEAIVSDTRSSFLFRPQMSAVPEPRQEAHL